MTKTKHALLMSGLALLLCVSMLVGSTYAWFTDSVTSTGNIIKSGKLDVTMHWADGTEAVPALDSTAWIDASSGAIFTNDKWEPGYVEVCHLKVENVGTLALKYQLSILANGEVSDLVKVIDVYYADPAVKVEGRAMTELTRLGTLEEVLAGMATSASGNLEANTNHTITLALKMRESAGNEYQEKSIGTDFSVQLFATQLAYENDSFDNQYDKDAWHPQMVATSAENFRTALSNGGNITVDGTIDADGTITVPWNSNRQTEYIIDAEKVNEVNGGDYVLDDGANWGFTVEVDSGETLALKDMNITADSAWVMNMTNKGTLTLSDITILASDGAGVYAYGANGTTTLNNLNVNHVNLSDPSAPWAATAVATSNGHHLIINDGIYVGSTYGVFVYNSGGRVTINGGTFKAPYVLAADGSYTDPTVRGELYVNGGNFDGKINMTNGYAYCEINGGNFTNFSVSTYSPVVIKGGTFDANPSSYVADGCFVIDNGDGTYTVSKNIVVADKGYDSIDELFADTTLTGEVEVKLHDDVVTSEGVVNDVTDTHYVFSTDSASGVEMTWNVGSWQQVKNVTIDEGVTLNLGFLRVAEGGTFTVKSGATLNVNLQAAGSIFNYGTFIIEEGATVNMTVAYKNYNSGVTNVYGTLNVGKDLTMQSGSMGSFNVIGQNARVVADKLYINQTANSINIKEGATMEVVGDLMYFGAKSSALNIDNASVTANKITYSKNQGSSTAFINLTNNASLAVNGDVVTYAAWSTATKDHVVTVTIDTDATSTFTYGNLVS